MLRGSDLLSLRVFELIHNDAQPRREVLQRQKKTKGNVSPVLTDTTQRAVLDWVRHSGKSPNDYVFTRFKASSGPPISESHFREIIKSWAVAIGLNPERYSGHSLRRTKAIYLYKFGFADIPLISELLGHSSVEVTLVYLGITRTEAQDAALRGDMFTADPQASPFSHPLLSHLLRPEFLEPFSEALAQHLAPKVAVLIDENAKKGR